MTHQTLDRDAAIEFLYRMTFGRGAPRRQCDEWTRYARLAYRDFARTIRFNGLIADTRKTARDAGVGVVVGSIATLDQLPKEQAAFDTWHRSTCDELSDAYTAAGGPLLAVGQLQKWINMTLKYLVTATLVYPDGGLGERLDLASHFHLPLDVISMSNLGKAKPGRVRRPEGWSRISDYDEYMEIQRLCREVSGGAALSFDFLTW